MKIVRRTSVSLSLQVATILLAVLAAGCNGGKSAPTPENFTAAINNHFLDHTDCPFSDTRFPFETSDSAKMKQMDALVDAHLLDRSVENSIHVARYTIAPAGTRFAPHFAPETSSTSTSVRHFV